MPWQRHLMETVSALLALFEENPPVDSKIQNTPQIISAGNVNPMPEGS